MGGTCRKLKDGRRDSRGQGICSPSRRPPFPAALRVAAFLYGSTPRGWPFFPQGFVGSDNIHLFPFPVGSRCGGGALLLHILLPLLCILPTSFTFPYRFPYLFPSLKIVPSEYVICFLCQLLHY